MDMNLLDSLTDAPSLLLSTERNADLFDTDAFGDPSHPDSYLFLSSDPFATDPDSSPPVSYTESPPQAPPSKSELVLHPFDTPAIPLANSVSDIPHHPIASVSAAHVHVPTPLSSAPAGVASPLQENRAFSGNVGAGKGVTGKRVKGGKKPMGVKKEPVDEAARVKDKLAQRKLRNKESARRYREKQVARRRQLENYTRTLTEQNRELENLHDRLLRLTCERRMGGGGGGGLL